MSARRRQNKHLRPPRPLDMARHPRLEQTTRGTFLVRDVPAAAAAKTYVCPGCGAPIPPGTAHVVAWPRTPDIGFSSGPEQRRHWHRHCWRIA